MLFDPGGGEPGGEPGAAARLAAARRLADGPLVEAWIDVRELRSLLSRGLYEPAIAVGLRGRARAEAAGGGRGLLANLSFGLGRAYAELGRPAEALDFYQQADRFFDLPRDKAMSLEGVAIARARLQQPLAALADLDQIADNYRLLGDRASASRAKANLAIALSEGGEWERSPRLFREALAEQSGGPATAADRVYTRSAFGAALLERGRLAEAAEQYLAALADLAGLAHPDPPQQVRVLRNLGELETLRGAPEAARRYFGQALALDRELGVPAETAAVLAQMADAEASCDQIVRAAALLAEARGLAPPELAPEIDLAASRIELKKENFSHVAELAQAVLDRRPGPELHFQALLVLARSHLARAKSGAAGLDTARDRIHAAKQLAVRNERRRAEAEMLLAVAELRGGEPGATARLARLESELTARGFRLFAREAAEWRRELSPGPPR